VYDRVEQESTGKKFGGGGLQTQLPAAPPGSLPRGRESPSNGDFLRLAHPVRLGYPASFGWHILRGSAIQLPNAIGSSLHLSPTPCDFCSHIRSGPPLLSSPSPEPQPPRPCSRWRAAMSVAARVSQEIGPQAWPRGGLLHPVQGLHVGEDGDQVHDRDGMRASSSASRTWQAMAS